MRRAPLWVMYGMGKRPITASTGISTAPMGSASSGLRANQRDSTNDMAT